MGITPEAFMQLLVLLTGLLASQLSQSQPEIALVPIDSRPAAAQFPTMIADIAGISISSPNDSELGKFTTPGNAAAIASWLVKRDYTNSVGLVVSADMIAYGGLIESRVPNVSLETALKRLECLTEVRKLRPSLPIYVFSALMRTAPTATNATKSWRMKLARYVELQNRYQETHESSLLSSMRSLRRQIPSKELDNYLDARKRNLAVHQQLIRMAKQGVINYLVIGADDAQQFGPHVAETRILKELAAELSISGLVYFCEGVDQNAILLVSRAALRNRKFMPKIIVRLSEASAGNRRMPYEAKPLSEVVRDQIIASGARPTTDPAEANYTLLLNVPDTESSSFTTFTDSLKEGLQQKANVALADINFDRTGGGDPKMLEFLLQQPDLGNLLAFAGWNTASNSIGTAVPHANMLLLARQTEENAEHRELAHREFLLHRLVGDYGYHRTIRPKAYQLVDALPGATREQLTPEAFRVVENYVVRSTKSLVESYFKDTFFERTFKASSKEYKITGLSGVAVTLPWPRVFETSVKLQMNVQEITKQGRRP